jgi:methylmalonyl-CoA mutase
MTELALAREFEAATRDAWMALVGKALKGGDFEKKLVGRTYDGIQIAPLYGRDGARKEAGAAERGAGRVRDGLAWDIRQCATGADPAAVNANLLEDLDGGASGITLRMAAPGQAGLAVDAVAIARALDGVRLDWGVSVALEAGGAYDGAGEALLAALAATGRDATQCTLALNADPLGALARAGGLPRDGAQSMAAVARLFDLTASLPKVRAGLVDGRPYHHAGASEAQELACMASTLVAYLRALETAGHAPSTTFARMAFTLSADAQIFPTIAKLRAARRLIARIAEASGAGASGQAVHLSVETSGRMMAGRDAYTNLLRTTVACAAAAMGGADAITVLPFSWVLGQPDALARRMARNTQIVLMEESSLGRVADPAGGSWYVEQLTDALALKAWALFQEIEGKGGMFAALQSGHVQAIIAKTAAERARNLSTGREELIGIANFPDLKEAGFKVEPYPAAGESDEFAITAEPLPLRRLAAPFEALRDAADAYAARTKKPPRIFLANLGTIPEFGARATFAQNFFAAGGIEALSNDGYTNTADVGLAFAESGATVACLCSSDANYALQAEAAAQALKAVGAQHVYLAGRPPSEKDGDKLEVFRAAGIGSYIFAGCDAPDTLAKAQDLLGVKA